MGVINGVTSSQINAARTGLYGGLGWSLLLQSGSANSRDLLFGPSAADTQESLRQAASGLRSVYNLQSAIVNNSLNYDCTVHVANGACVSVGARTAVTNSLSGDAVSALLVGSYKLSDRVRIGGYVDQNVPVANVNGIQVDKSPVYGTFGVWNQNPDAIAGTVSYAMKLTDSSWVVAPYAGLRRTKVSRKGYSETESSSVTAPLTFNAFYRKEAFQASGNTTGMLVYQLGL